ncbi:hypothetical protein CapIbe_005545 [Capra ibex]
METGKKNLTVFSVRKTSRNELHAGAHCSQSLFFKSILMRKQRRAGRKGENGSFAEHSVMFSIAAALSYVLSNSTVCRILVLRPGIETTPSAGES